MAKRRAVNGGNKTGKGNGVNIGYEAERWQIADALRGSFIFLR